MNDKTINWLAGLFIGLGSGFMVTGLAALILGDQSKPLTYTTGAAMFAVSFFLIVASYVAAMQGINR